jgi:hypothetical protein
MAAPAFRQRLQGTRTPEVLHEAAMRKLAADRNIEYENHEFLVPAPASALSIKTIVNHATNCTCGRASGAFGLIARTPRLSVRNTGTGPIAVRMNQATADPLTVEDGERFDWDYTEVADVFFDNAGGEAIPVRVLLA